jgi:hypothetical protein
MTTESIMSRCSGPMVWNDSSKESIVVLSTAQ